LKASDELSFDVRRKINGIIRQSQKELLKQEEKLVKLHEHVIARKRNEMPSPKKKNNFSPDFKRPSKF